MLRRWKYEDRATLLMWASKIKVLSRMTPRLFTWSDGGSVLSLFSLMKLSENHDLISSRQLDRAVGGRVEVGLVDI